MTPLRVARLWSGVAAGVPTLDGELSRANPSTPRDKILAFLEDGSVVLRAAGKSEDWLAPGHPLLVAIGFRTDGKWLWSEELAYYLRQHDVLPESDFLAHMSEHAFVARSASEAQIRDAEALLRGTS